MFRRKYVFETKQTKTFRYLKNIFFLSLIVGSCFIIAGPLFIMAAQKETAKTEDALFQRPPDLIVVFTGDKGRIPYALKISKKYSQPHMLITGVYAKNSVKTLIDPITGTSTMDTNLLEIDYLARNTFENVLSTLRYLNKKKGLKRIVVVSHDYHIVRSKVLVNGIKSPQDDYEFYFAGVDSKLNNIRNLKILYKEVYKFVKSLAFLIFWEGDSEILNS